MINKKIEELIFDVIDEINMQNPMDEQIEKSLDTELHGENGTLNSLALVSFIVAIEQKTEDELGVVVSLTDEKTLSQINSPFRTVKTLVDYIMVLAKEKEV